MSSSFLPQHYCDNHPSNSAYIQYSVTPYPMFLSLSCFAKVIQISKNYYCFDMVM